MELGGSKKPILKGNAKTMDLRLFNVVAIFFIPLAASGIMDEDGCSSSFFFRDGGLLRRARSITRRERRRQNAGTDEEEEPTAFRVRQQEETMSEMSLMHSELLGDLEAAEEATQRLEDLTQGMLEEGAEAAEAANGTRAAMEGASGRLEADGGYYAGALCLAAAAEAAVLICAARDLYRRARGRKGEVSLTPF